MIRKLAAVIVLVLVVCTIAGCTTSNTNQTPTATSSATSSTATYRDALLEKYLAAYKNTSYSNRSSHVKAWELTWINSTSAHLQWTVVDKPSNHTYTYDQTIMVFSLQAATQYLNAINKTAYSLASAEYPSGGAYQNATGHAPQIYRNYVWNEGNPSNMSEHKYHQISQLDNIVFVSTGKNLG